MEGLLPGDRSADEWFHRVAHVDDFQPIGQLGRQPACRVKRLDELAFEWQENHVPK